MLDALQAMTDAHAAELAELRALGLRIARAVAADVEQAETAQDRKAAAQTFPAIARAVRQCQALEAHARRALVKDQELAERRAREVEVAEEQKAAAAEQARAEEREHRKAPVWDRVLDVIEDQCSGDDHEALDEFRRRKEDLRTRLDDETFEAEFAGLPYETVIRTVHRDLGLPEPEFGPPDRVRALLWDAQWGERAAPEAPSPEPPPGEPDPPPEPYFRYSSG